MIFKINHIYPEEVELWNDSVTLHIGDFYPKEDGEYVFQADHSYTFPLDTLLLTLILKKLEELNSCGT